MLVICRQHALGRPTDLIILFFSCRIHCTSHTLRSPFNLIHFRISYFEFLPCHFSFVIVSNCVYTVIPYTLRFLKARCVSAFILVDYMGFASVECTEFSSYVKCVCLVWCVYFILGISLFVEVFARQSCT